MKKVVFTGDVLRFSVHGTSVANSQRSNILWLWSLFGGVDAWAARGFKASVILPPGNFAEAEQWLSPDGLMEYVASPDDAWLRRFSSDGPRDYAAIAERLESADLVVGFELPPSLRRNLDSAGLNYVNFFVHPVRFLDDLCLSATSNVQALRESLSAHSIGDVPIQHSIRRWRALSSRHRCAAAAIPPGAALVAAQTERDSVLIDGQQFAAWPQYKETVRALLAGIDNVVLLEHPYRRNHSAIAEFFRCELGKTVISTNANAYAVLFSTVDAPVMLTLASSLGVEARHVGYQVQFLLGDPRARLRIHSIEGASDSGPLGHGVLVDDWWRLPTARTSKRRARAPFFLGSDYLRGTLEAWSYDALRAGVHRVHSRKTIYPAAKASSKELHEVGQAVFGMELAETTFAETPTLVSQTVGLVEMQVMDAPIQVGEVRDVDMHAVAAKAYLGSGWHDKESWGAWMSGHRAALVVPLAGGGGRLNLTLSVHAVDVILGSAPVLRISSGSLTLAYAFFGHRSKGHSVVMVQIETAPEQRLCEVMLEISHIMSPLAAGQSGDERLLGIGLDALHLEYDDAGLTSDVRPVNAGIGSSDGLRLALIGIY